MTLIRLFNETIWPCIEPTVAYLAEKRREALPDPVRSGLNFSIALGAACYLEGVLETLLRALLACRRSEFGQVKIPEFGLRRSMNVYYNRLEEDLAGRIGRAVGAAGYDDMFQLLAGQRLSQLKEVTPLWEAVTVLFSFRNVLGHGREVSARHYIGALVEGGIQGGFCRGL